MSTSHADHLPRVDPPPRGLRRGAVPTGYRRLLDLPAAVVADLTVTMAAHTDGLCANCRSPYAEGAMIGYSRQAGGWVSSCCD